MNRSEAEQRARALQDEHPDRATHRFIARETAEGAWQVVKLRAPGLAAPTPLVPTVEAQSRPPYSDDPRSGHEQRAPGPPGGLG